jgi:hypothetical protein
LLLSVLLYVVGIIMLDSNYHIAADSTIAFLQLVLEVVCQICCSLKNYSYTLESFCCRFFRYILLLFLMHQLAIALFRTIGALGRSMVIANTFGSFALLVVFLLGGFILARRKSTPHNTYIKDILFLYSLAYSRNNSMLRKMIES